MATFLLDTNHLGQAVSSKSTLRATIAKRRAEGDRFGTCAPVLCELEVGIQQTTDPDQYRRDLRHLLRAMRLWPLDLETARIYGQFRQDLKRRGRSLSQVDVMLAALAIQLDLTLLSTDKDFDALPQVKRQNWL